MKPSEAAKILAKISAYDRRTVGDADAEAWAEALDGQVTFNDALTAVRDHYRTSTEWLMPAQVIKLGREARSRRVRETGVPDLPANLTAAQEREWLRTFWSVLHDYGDGEQGRAAYAASMKLGLVETTATHMLPPDVVKAKIAAFGASLKSIPGHPATNRTEQQQ